MKITGVAYSAGADSTCLLFLLVKLATSASHKNEFANEVHAFHVNHALQDANNKMVSVAENTARVLRAHAHMLSIPWGTPPYPPKPATTKDQPMEELARKARYRRLFDGMKQDKVDVVAFGHHADDQVETALMRWRMGSKSFGMAGMLNVRRWGMG